MPQKACQVASDAKHPARLQTFELSFGKAHVFYPEATQERCTAAVLLDVDPVALSRGRTGAGGPPLEPYVNDRPYVARWDRLHPHRPAVL